MRRTIALAVSVAALLGVSLESEGRAQRRHPPATLLFSVAVPLGDGSDSRLYIVLDETRGAGRAAAGEPVALGDDGIVAVSARPVDMAALPARLRTLAASRFVALHADCAGGLGSVVELTLRSGAGADDPTYRQTVLAAPMDPACDQDSRAVHVESAPPARVYRTTDIELDEASRARVTTALRRLPEHRRIQAEVERENEEPLGRPWDEDYEITFAVLRDPAGHELVRVDAGGRDRPFSALFERSRASYVLRAVAPGSLVVDLEGDGIVETVDRLGLLRLRRRVRSFARGPFVLGC